MIAILSTKPTFLAVLFLRPLAMAARSVIDAGVRWRFRVGESIAKHKVSLKPTRSPTPAPPSPG
jgi:hypothetical protein